MNLNGIDVMCGTVFLTDDVDFLKAVPLDIVKIITLEEHGVVKRTMPDVIVGTILLPPTEAIIAEADGDEEMYNIHYQAWFNCQPVLDFVAALVGALYMNKSLLFYVEEIKDNFAVAKMMEFMWKLFGIGIGIMGSRRCEYDPRCIPIWLNMVYTNNVIDAREFLYVYPPNTYINPVNMAKLVNEINPYGLTYNDKVQSIIEYMNRLKVKPKTIQPIYGMR